MSRKKSNDSDAHLRSGRIVEADPSNKKRVPVGGAAEVKRSYVVQVGSRGTLTLPADLRKRFAIDEATLLQITEEAEWFRVRTVQVVPFNAPRKADLDELLAEVTPANLHEEFDFGSSIGAETR